MRAPDRVRAAVARAVVDDAGLDRKGGRAVVATQLGLDRGETLEHELARVPGDDDDREVDHARRPATRRGSLSASASSSRAAASTASGEMLRMQVAAAQPLRHGLHGTGTRSWREGTSG